MATSNEKLLAHLVGEVAALQPLYREHTDSDGTVLVYPFFGDMTKLIQTWAAHGARERRRDVRRILDLLEEALSSRDSDLDDLVSLGFVELLDPKAPGYDDVRSAMGPRLRNALAQYEGK